jgi:uncharacterized RDD family membrane protein YckC
MAEKEVTVAGEHYELATWPQRIVAKSIDLVVVVIIFVVGETIFPSTGYLASTVYLFSGNGLLLGRSIGKRIVGLRVIDARHGRPISMVQDLVRHRYLLFLNLIFLFLTAYDESQGCFDKPETYVVKASEGSLFEAARKG